VRRLPAYVCARKHQSTPLRAAWPFELIQVNIASRHLMNCST
jgi:hypothetical protein